MLTRIRICIVSRISRAHDKSEDASCKCSMNATERQLRPSGIRDIMVLSVRREWALAAALIRS